MAFDFPATPSVGQVFGNYIWDGEKWKLQGGQALGAVRYDTPQILSAGQQTQARHNIAASGLDALGWSGMQINGSMEVSQERGAGTTAGWLNTAGYAVDGWFVNARQATAGTTAFTIGQVASVLPGISQCLSMTATSAANFSGATDMAIMQNIIEGYRFSRVSFGYASAQPVTIGFWVYTSVPGTACVLLGGYGTQSRCYIQEFTVLAGNTWEYKTLTFPPDVTTPANWLTNNSRGASIIFCFGGGATTKGGTAGVWANWVAQYATGNQTNFFASNNTAVYLTGVVVLPGVEAPTAAQSPLIMRPYDQELLTCQRYFYNGPLLLAGNIFNATTISRLAGPHPVTMRGLPTLTMTAAMSTTATVLTGLLTNYSSVRLVEVDATATGLVGNALIKTVPSQGGNINVDARL